MVVSPPTGGCSLPSSTSDWSPVGFAAAERLTRAQMLNAPVRWPRPSRLGEPLVHKAAKTRDGLAALGLDTVGDLLAHMPRDRREARTIAELQAGEQATVLVEVRSIAGRQVRRRGMRGLVEAVVFDETGSMRVTFFNQPWLVSRYPAGTRLVLHGKAEQGGRFKVSHHAIGSREGASEAGDVGVRPSGSMAAVGGAPGSGQGGSVAHYPAAEGVSSTQILALVQEHGSALGEVVEPLAAQVRVPQRLPGRASALAAMHFSGPNASQEGRRRLAFDELLLAQLVFLIRREQRASEARALALREPPSLSARWLKRSLPFELTGDQRKAIATIEGELAEQRPMQRLLMGEVGSGKTVVALHAMLRAVEHGAQAALMAPTETLAEQHFATLQKLLGGESVAIALLTGSTPARRRADILGKLVSGELTLVVGTHALIEPDVRFRALAVAVVDEQHRFGVRQRAALGESESTGQDLDLRKVGDGERPHMLHMTATPIPRTLALARHGDLDRTLLRELPLQRRPIETRIVAGESGREEAYRLLREQLGQGRQAYVVCPLVEDGEELAARPPARAGDGGEEPGELHPEGHTLKSAGMRAASAECERLRTGELKGFQVELLHGQMRPRAKQAAMDAFARGRAQVLVATTVIEVGVDVPNATVMLVENAERFGISQLHQLRGRVGRGEHPSTCLLMTPFAGSQRLQALAKHSDGFKLAEIDLRLRKEGELVGTKQSGLGQFKFASLPEDGELLEQARSWARKVLALDPRLEGPLFGLLGEALQEAFGAEALQPIPA
jgi:ATP-dependent DNA helicase RecG